jgi:hypothetical protein
MIHKTDEYPLKKHLLPMNKLYHLKLIFFSAVYEKGRKHAVFELHDLINGTIITIQALQHDKCLTAKRVQYAAPALSREKMLIVCYLPNTYRKKKLALFTLYNTTWTADEVFLSGGFHFTLQSQHTYPYLTLFGDIYLFWENRRHLDLHLLRESKNYKVMNQSLSVPPGSGWPKSFFLDTARKHFISFYSEQKKSRKTGRISDIFAVLKLLRFNCLPPDGAISVDFLDEYQIIFHNYFTMDHQLFMFGDGLFSIPVCQYPRKRGRRVKTYRFVLVFEPVDY